MSDRRALRLDRITLIAFLPIAAAILLWLLDLGGYEALPGDRYDVHAVVPTSDALAPQAEVRIDGVVAGRVTDIAAHGSRGRETMLLLEIDREHAPLFRDARARIRLRTLVGENYVELNPGRPSSGELPDGGTLGIERAEEYVASDEVFSTFDRKRRRQLRGQLEALGVALDGRGAELNRMFEASASLAGSGSAVIGRLAEQREQVAELIDSFGAVMAAVGERGADVERFSRSSRRALGAFAAREEQVRQALDELPETLRQARRTANGLAELSGGATPVLADLRAALDRLEPVIADLEPAARVTRGTVASLERFADRGEPALAALERFSVPTSEALPELGGLLGHYNPFASYAKPRRRELMAFLANMRSLSDAEDQIGKVARLNTVVTPTTVSGYMTPEMAELYARLRASGAITDSVGPHYVNAYPAPGTIDDPGRFEGPYERIKPERDARGGG